MSLTHTLLQEDVLEAIQLIKPKIEEVKTSIEETTHGVNRRPADVRLIAVTKYHSVAYAAAAVHLGITDLAENRVEPFLARQELINRYCIEHGLPEPRWHYVGSLQRNKVKQLGGKMDAFHALDSLRLAKRINLIYTRMGEVLPVYLQLNVTGEESKHGFELSELYEVWGDLTELPGIRIAGLMTMAEREASVGRLHETFSKLAQTGNELTNRLRSGGYMADNEKLRLSMGMSGDYISAIEEGATDIRLGSALFGPSKP